MPKFLLGSQKRVFYVELGRSTYLTDEVHAVTERRSIVSFDTRRTLLNVFQLFSC